MTSTVNLPELPGNMNSVNIPELQLDSKKCTGRYFKVRDDDLSSKQGSLLTYKMILIKISHKYL